MKRIILVLAMVLCASGVWADQEEPVTFIMSGAISTWAFYEMESTDPTWKNWVVASAIGAAWGVAQDHNNKEAAVAGAITGCIAGKYFWLKYGEDETIAGVTLRW